MPLIATFHISRPALWHVKIMRVGSTADKNWTPCADGRSGRVRAVDLRALRVAIRRSPSMPTWSTEVIELTKAIANFHLLSDNSAAGTCRVRLLDERRDL
jgi:hypothetical protein